ncbi:MAG: hypothetical protein IBJ00_04395 [Alphaproteobacteria bacterium]|nr:hypothetical protein [Alphaproteobacteria bacterium]
MRVLTLAEDLHYSGIPIEKVLFDQWSGRPGAGTDVYRHLDNILKAQKVILVGSYGLKEQYEQDKPSTLRQEINLLRTRISQKGSTLDKHPSYRPTRETLKQEKLLKTIVNLL